MTRSRHFQKTGTSRRTLVQIHAHEAIIDKGLFERVQAKPHNRSRFFTQLLLNSCREFQ